MGKIISPASIALISEILCHSVSNIENPNQLCLLRRLALNIQIATLGKILSYLYELKRRTNLGSVTYPPFGNG